MHFVDGKTFTDSFTREMLESHSKCSLTPTGTTSSAVDGCQRTEGNVHESLVIQMRNMTTWFLTLLASWLLCCSTTDASSPTASHLALHLGRRVDQWMSNSRLSRRGEQTPIPEPLYRRGGSRAAAKTMTAAQMEVFRYVRCCREISRSTPIWSSGLSCLY